MRAFTPGPPKRSEPCTPTALRAAIAAGSKPTGAKTVGDGTVKIFMTGDCNFYCPDSPALRSILNRYEVIP